MFKAILRSTVSVRCKEDRTQKVFRCSLVLECEIPFKPCIGDQFYVGEDEEDVVMVHYDIGKKRFEIACGGMLCENEDEAKSSIEYGISNGWTVERERKE